MSEPRVLNIVNVESALIAHLAGRQLTEVARRDHDWAFQFGHAAVSGLRVECPWRIIVAKRIALASADDGHKFGLKTPLNGEAEVRRLLGESAIEGVSIRSDTGDLSIAFAGNRILEVLNMSSEYEGWEFGVPGLLVIASGGGELTTFVEEE